MFKGGKKMKKKFNSPGNKKISEKWRIVTVGGVVVILSIVGGCYLYITRGTSGQTDKPVINQNIENEKKIKVLLTSKSMTAGDYIDSTYYDEVEYLQEEIPEDAVLDPIELQGKILRNDLEQGSIIRRKDLLHKMPYEENDRFVEHNFIDGAIPTTIPPEQLIGSIVDINLFKSGAVDEIVVSKATIVAKDGNKLAFHLNPIEQEYLKEASTEGVYYLTAYLEKNQKASEVTYRPSYSK